MNKDKWEEITFKKFWSMIGGDQNYYKYIDRKVKCQCGYIDRIFVFIKEVKGLVLDNWTKVGPVNICDHLYCPKCGSTMIYYDKDGWMVEEL